KKTRLFTISGFYCEGFTFFRSHLKLRQIATTATCLYFSSPATTASAKDSNSNERSRKQCLKNQPSDQQQHRELSIKPSLRGTKRHLRRDQQISHRITSLII
ncbi:TPA: hypothetical protein ACWS1B_004843, partial [Escherichia coli]|uniref:hypothetical protein n=1 Tax=Escherichia coli TaxID=562 RepID=UPI0035CE3DD6